MADHVQPENMVVDFVGILVKATKGINLVVSTIRDRGINLQVVKSVLPNQGFWSSGVFLKSLRTPETLKKQEKSRICLKSKEIAVAYKARGSLSQGSRYFWPISIVIQAAFDR